MSGRETNLTKNMSYDRILKLAPLEGKTQEDVSGRADPRLFTGENKLHALMDPEYGHWFVRYEAGNIPTSMQQRWTSFPRMLSWLEDYYKKRNMRIIEIIDTA